MVENRVRYTEWKWARNHLISSTLYDKRYRS